MEQNYLQELQAVRVCQQQTAQILNHDLERHALNPAIETIVAMAEEFMRLEQTISHLKLKSGLCPAWAEVAGELEISATVVAEKLRALDIVILRPQCNQPFDAALHDICGQLETGDAQLQSKIQSVIASGIQYRNKLLKRARIIVYRHKSNQPIHEQENLK
jgi:molecular chaperone GrpE (heat shock protein)